MIMWSTWLKRPHVGLVYLISLAYIFIKYQLLKGTKLSFIVHLEFFHIRHKHMINLKESTLVNESIKGLKYKTLRYIKANPHVHLTWICNALYTLLLISKVEFHLQWIMDKHVYRVTWCCELQCNGKLIIKQLNNNHKRVGKILLI
jgi:hypothetical protein